MRAYVLRRYGGPAAAQLDDVPTPSPGADDVLIQVKAAALNPVDYKFRRGVLKPIYRPTLPVVMGHDLAGTVTGSGAKVTRFSAGDRVYACCGISRSGAFAEYACVHQDLVAKMPTSLDFENAASIPLAGLTALQCLRDQLRVTAGDRILITAGAGGVGTLAIQIAKWLRAFVATTVSPRGQELVEKLGADQVIDYTRHDLANEVAQFDAVFDLVGGKTLSKTFKAVKRSGTVISIAGVPEPNTAADLGRGSALAALFWLISFPVRLKAWKAGACYRYYFMHPSGAELGELTELIDGGHLAPIIDRTFPFSEIADAFAFLEQGHAKGKVVVHFR